MGWSGPGPPWVIQTHRPWGPMRRAPPRLCPYQRRPPAPGAGCAWPEPPLERTARGLAGRRGRRRSRRPRALAPPPRAAALAAVSLRPGPPTVPDPRFGSRAPTHGAAAARRAAHRDPAGLREPRRRLHQRGARLRHGHGPRVRQGQPQDAGAPPAIPGPSRPRGSWGRGAGRGSRAAPSRLASPPRAAPGLAEPDLQGGRAQFLCVGCPGLGRCRINAVPFAGRTGDSAACFLRPSGVGWLPNSGPRALQPVGPQRWRRRGRRQTPQPRLRLGGSLACVWALFPSLARYIAAKYLREIAMLHQ